MPKSQNPVRSQPSFGISPCCSAVQDVAFHSGGCKEQLNMIFEASPAIELLLPRFVLVSNMLTLVVE